MDDYFMLVFGLFAATFLVLAIPLSIYKQDFGYITISLLYAMIVSSINMYVEKD